MRPPRLFALLRVHPDSAAAPLGRGRWYPLMHLVWLAWTIAAPWYVPVANRPFVTALTAASVAIFLPLYLRAWYGDGRRIVWNTVMIALLGLVTIPVNTSWSYIVYAAVLIPFCTTPRRSLGWMALLMGTFYVVAIAAGFGNGFAFFAMGMCTMLFLVNLVGRVNNLHDAQLRLSHDEVRRLAATAERERIGRDLHDLLGHTLGLVAVKSELARRLLDRDADGARREVAEIEGIARDALAQVRCAVTGIRAAGIAAELAAARLLLGSAGITLSYEGEDLPLTPEVESALALGLREAATNVQRHARARHVEVTLTRDGRHARLVVRDDGRGGVKTRGNGLTGIDERLAAVGGRATTDSASGRGTRIELRAPLAASRDAASAAAIDRITA